MHMKEKKPPLLWTGGYRYLEAATKNDYDLLEDIFSVDYEPHMNYPLWDDRDSDLGNWIDDVVIEGLDLTAPGDRIVVGGFSLGGLLAYLAARELEIQGRDVRLACASVSSWFRPLVGDSMLHSPESELNTIMPKWLREQLAYNCLSIPIFGPSLYFLGENEITGPGNVNKAYDFLVSHSLDAKGIVVPEVGHEIFDPAYIDCIRRSIGKLATQEARPTVEKIQHALKLLGLICTEELNGLPTHDEDYFQRYTSQIDMWKDEVMADFSIP